MKELVFPHVEKRIVFDCQTVFNLVIENPRELRDALNGIQNQIDHDDVFLHYYDGEKELGLKKNGYLILDPLHISVDEKKTSTTIQKDISTHISIEQKEEFESLVNRINDYLETLCLNYSIPLTFDSDLSLPALLKAISLTSSTENDSYLEYLIQEIRKISVIFGQTLFFLYNLHDYLTEEELLSFIHEMRLNEIQFVLISSHLPRVILDSEYVIRLDNDLCELHLTGKEVFDKI